MWRLIRTKTSTLLAIHATWFVFHNEETFEYTPLPPVTVTNVSTRLMTTMLWQPTTAEVKEPQKCTPVCVVRLTTPFEIIGK